MHQDSADGHVCDLNGAKVEFIIRASRNQTQSHTQ